VAFGLLIRPDALVVPDAGFVNVHFSLLPRWRGAAPVQRAMLAGDRRSGVTLMQLDEGLDTGPTLATLSTGIGRNETGGVLTRRLSALGADLVRRHLAPIVAGSITPVPQPVSGVTLAPKLDSSDRRFIAGTDAKTLRRSIMAMAPAPGLTADLAGRPVKLLQAGDVRDGTDLPPGALEVIDGRLWCSAEDGRVEILLIQSAGRRPVTGIDWARGQAPALGRLE
jgi:methionyl-tRNA formyltransferase